jgi:hypothetical protein
MRAETHVGLNVKCPLFLADVNEKGNGRTFFLKIHQYQISGVLLYVQTRDLIGHSVATLTRLKNNSKSHCVFAQYFGVIGEVGQAACTSAVTYS